MLQSREILYPAIGTLGLNEKWFPGKPESEAKNLAYEKLRKMIRISEVPDTFKMRVSATSTEPKGAADLANTIALVYEQRRLNDADQRIQKNFTDLVEIEQRNVNEAETEAAKIRDRDHIVDSDPQNSDDKTHPQYQVAKQKYIDAKTKLDAAEQNLENIEFQMKAYPRTATIQEAAQPAKVPSTPNNPRILLLAFCAGLLPAIPGAFMLFSGLRSRL